MNSTKMARIVADVLSRRKGRDIVIIDIGEKSSLADYFVIASGGSDRQIAALTDDVEEALVKEQIHVRNIEGTGASGWILMDYGDILVSVLTEEMRERYNIEKVWADCDRLPLKEEQ